MREALLLLVAVCGASFEAHLGHDDEDSGGEFNPDIRDAFTQIYKTNKWLELGLEQGGSRSGHSSVVQTVQLRRALRTVIDEFNITSMLDAPCGDMMYCALGASLGRISTAPCRCEFSAGLQIHVALPGRATKGEARVSLRRHGPSAVKAFSRPHRGAPCRIARVQAWTLWSTSLKKTSADMPTAIGNFETSMSRYNQWKGSESGADVGQSRRRCGPASSGADVGLLRPPVSSALPSGHSVRWHATTVRYRRADTDLCTP